MALVAIARKLLRIIYAIVRDDSEYKADYGLLKRNLPLRRCMRPSTTEYTTPVDILTPIKQGKSAVCDFQIIRVG